MQPFSTLFQLSTELATSGYCYYCFVRYSFLAKCSILPSSIKSTGDSVGRKHPTCHDALQLIDTIFSLAIKLQLHLSKCFCSSSFEQSVALYGLSLTGYISFQHILLNTNKTISQFVLECQSWEISTLTKLYVGEKKIKRVGTFQSHLFPIKNTITDKSWNKNKNCSSLVSIFILHYLLCQMHVDVSTTRNLPCNQAQARLSLACLKFHQL